ncbi:MAG: RagB/SusD family nutrient uptake outer membrane protein [Tannerella sp.]|jgi:hypothetical protein|nr:RagB/SusD family nutrient uptake outer membrane protein [Tannerella sp.]
MKKIITIIAVAVSICACKSDLLDTFPYDKAGTGNVWTVESLADQGVVGIYNVLAHEHVAGRIDYYETYGPQAFNIWIWGWITYVTNTISPSDGMFSGNWNSHYEMISRANDAIANLHSAPLTEAKFNRLMCESKFLRAYAYFRLNRIFHGVPVYLENLSAEEYNRPRETPEKVWQTVIDDLTDCINNPDFPGRYNADDVNYGRATKGAAYTLRGMTYLWTKEYAKAESDFKEVGKLGYELFQGGYEALFTEANERCPEMIFSRQCVRDPTGFGNSLSRWCGNGGTYQNGVNETAFTPDFVDTYENKDGTPFNWNDVFPGYNSMTPDQRLVYFLRDNMTDAEKTSLSTADMTKYLPTGNEARIKAVYANRDPRLNATIITPYCAYLGGRDGVTSNYELRWPFRNLDDGDIRTNSNTSFYYLYRKFICTGGDPYINRDNSPIDIPLMRYAGVLLYLAEALNEQGDSKRAEAIGYVNQVRRRAGLAELNSNAATTVTSQANLRERIRKEFRWEFTGEGVTLFEELRCGTYKESKFFPGAGQKQIHGANGKSQYHTFVWDDRLMKWAIPPSEIEKNPTLTPNPGW